LYIPGICPVAILPSASLMYGISFQPVGFKEAGCSIPRQLYIPGICPVAILPSASLMYGFSFQPVGFKEAGCSIPRHICLSPLRGPYRAALT
jgi:hypothetical protein